MPAAPPTDATAASTGAIWFVTGGARSGKSRFAERLASETGTPVVYIATLQPQDAEMDARVARHRADRPAHWATIEAPLSPTTAVTAAPDAACVIVDCLSLWVTNRLLPLGEQPTLDAIASLESTLERETLALCAAARARTGVTILVSNEVGSGLVPEHALGRAFRDLLGRVNQQAAMSAERAWLLVAGRALPLP